MARVKSTASRKHRVILKRVRGFRQARRIRIQVAKEALLHAGQYAYVGRKDRKGQFRRLWIVRLNAVLKNSGVSYSQFIAGLKKAKIELDRKMLAHLAVTEPKVLAEIAKKAGFNFTEPK